MTQKVALYILSMTLFFVIVGILCMDIPICLSGDWEFIGIDQLCKNSRVGIFIVVVSIVLEYLVFLFLKNLWNHSPKELSVEVQAVEEHNYDTLAFIASFMIPLVSFQLHQLSHWIVMLLLVVVIGVIFCNSKGYYTNPTLAVLGFHLYKLTVKTQQVDGGRNTRDIMVISRKRLDVNNSFRYVKITKDVGYVM